MHIKGVPVGKVNILGGHRTGHSKQKKSIYVHVSYSVEPVAGRRNHNPVVKVSTGD
jgi:hypothetical protein